MKKLAGNEFRTHVISEKAGIMFQGAEGACECFSASARLSEDNAFSVKIIFGCILWISCRSIDCLRLGECCGTFVDRSIYCVWVDVVAFLLIDSTIACWWHVGGKSNKRSFEAIPLPNKSNRADSIETYLDEFQG